MRLVAARSEVAAPDARPQGFHCPPLAQAASPSLVSSLHLSEVYYITFFEVVNAGMPENGEIYFAGRPGLGGGVYVREAPLCGAYSAKPAHGKSSLRAELGPDPFLQKAA